MTAASLTASKTGAERQKKYIARKKEQAAAMTVRLAAEASPENVAKMERLASLLQQARELAAEINADVVASLKAKPLDRETARLLDAYEGQEMRLSLAKVNLVL